VIATLRRNRRKQSKKRSWGRFLAGKRKFVLGAIIGVLGLTATTLWTTLVGHYGLRGVQAGIDEVQQRGLKPVEVRVLRFSQEFALPASPQRLGQPPEYCSSPEYQTWVKERGGVPAGDRFGLIVTARTNALVLFRGVELRLHERRPAAHHKAVISCPGGGAGPVYLVRVALGSGGPTVTYTNTLTDVTSKHLLARLVKGEPQAFELAVTVPTPEEVAWEADLLFSVDGREHRERVSDGGKPFLVTGRLPEIDKYQRIGYQWEQVSS
jgi:hypothetical protein